MIELRSDTFTRPTPQMREAMANAEVGDDVFSEDPTAIRLQDRCAALLGKEAGLFMPTGSMANEVAIHLQTTPGTDVVCGRDSHIVEAELGAPAALSGVMIRAVEWDRGVIADRVLRDAIRKPSPFFTHTSLLSLENTHQAGGGAVVELAELRRMSDIARESGARVHLDGARLFNAVVASGVSAAEYAACADTVMFCFSKGLGAPIGSMLVGDSETITRARKVRKMFGGGMRQIGLICAAAEVAITNGVDRLAEDHSNAKRLAAGLQQIWGAESVGTPDTNIVYVELGDADAAEVAQHLAGQGVAVVAMPGNRIRAVTSYEVDSDAIDAAVKAFELAAKI